MFSRKIGYAIRQKMIASTAIVSVLALSGVAIGQEHKPMPADHDKDVVRVETRLSTNASELKMAPRWQKSTDLIGKNVTNSGGDNLGEIEEIVVDPNSGRILYGVLSFGGFLGMGDKLFAIPWQALQLSGDNKAFTLNVDKDRLKSAPGFDKSQWPNFADEQWATNTHKYYNQTPYWQSKTAKEAADYRERWNLPATAWQKCSDLCGKDVVDARNEDTGELENCVIDPDGGRLIYGVVTFRDKFFAVPWGALTLSKDAKQLALNVNNDRLTDTISFGKDNWPNMADERWAKETFSYYRIQPYWTRLDAAVQR